MTLPIAQFWGRPTLVAASVFSVQWGPWHYLFLFVAGLIVIQKILPAVAPTTFSISMRIGLLVAVLLGFGQAPVVYLVPAKLLHMLILCGLARVHLTTWHRYLPDVAAKIGNTGYLHTLIGAMASLYALARGGDDHNAIVQAIAPIGSALLTSIIGWWASKEFQSYYSQKEESKAIILDAATKAEEKERVAAEARVVVIEMIAAQERMAAAKKLSEPSGDPSQPGTLTVEQITTISDAVSTIARQQVALHETAVTLEKFTDQSKDIRAALETCLTNLGVLNEILNLAPTVMKDLDQILARLKNDEVVRSGVTL